MQHLKPEVEEIPPKKIYTWEFGSYADESDYEHEYELKLTLSESGYELRLKKSMVALCTVIGRGAILDFQELMNEIPDLIDTFETSD